jgi:hypothetical protein
LLDGQAGVPFPGSQDWGANEESAGAPTLGIYHPLPQPCTTGTPDAPGWGTGRVICGPRSAHARPAELTALGLAATLPRAMVPRTQRSTSLGMRAA